MSKATDAANAAGYHNDHQISVRHGRDGDASTQKPYIAYMAGTTGRASHSAMWVVYRPGWATDSKAGWPTYQHKTFTVRSRDQRLDELAEAQRWAADRYHLDGGWERSPFGGWHPAEVLAAFHTAMRAGQKQEAGR